MKKLDKLTLEEVAMASAQLLKVTHDIHNVVTAIADGVEGVEQRVEVVAVQAEDIKCDIQVISDRVEGVDEKLQVILDGENIVMCSLETHICLDGKRGIAAAIEESSTIQQTAKKVEDMRRS